jgi:predicted  nucleic acid-binding Zn-ribbon protein
MNLVLTDISRWKTQLETEIIKIDEQIEHLKASRDMAKQKIAEAEELLEANNFSAESEVEAEDDTVAEAVQA